MTNASRSEAGSDDSATSRSLLQLGPVELFFGRRVARGLVVLVVAEVRAADVLQPVLAAVRDDPEHPGIEPPAHLGEMLVRLDERELKDVFRDVGAAGHAQRVTVQRITVPSDQHRELVAVAREHTLDDALIRVVLINDLFWFRRSHDDRVTRIALAGQGACPTVYCGSGRHVAGTMRRRERNRGVGARSRELAAPPRTRSSPARARAPSARRAAAAGRRTVPGTLGGSPVRADASAARASTSGTVRTIPHGTPAASSRASQSAAGRVGDRAGERPRPRAPAAPRRPAFVASDCVARRAPAARARRAQARHCASLPTATTSGRSAAWNS